MMTSLDSNILYSKDSKWNEQSQDLTYSKWAHSSSLWPISRNSLSPVSLEEMEWIRRKWREFLWGFGGGNKAQREKSGWERMHGEGKRKWTRKEKKYGEEKKYGLAVRNWHWYWFSKEADVFQSGPLGNLCTLHMWWMNIWEADPSRLKLCHTSCMHLAQKGSFTGDEGLPVMRQALSSFS